jgi:hypothetical protein
MSRTMRSAGAVELFPPRFMDSKVAASGTERHHTEVQKALYGFTIWRFRSALSCKESFPSKLGQLRLLHLRD